MKMFFFLFFFSIKTLCQTHTCWFVFTVEPGVQICVGGPHRQVCPAGGVQLRVPGVRDPGGLVRVSSQASPNAASCKRLEWFWPFLPGSAATRCWSYRCCLCWRLAWAWPSPSTCPCSASCASLKASAWRASSSPCTCSVSWTLS